MSQATDQPSAVMVRGRILPDTLVLDPVLIVDARPSLPEADGPHRLRGEDGEGRALFELRFQGTPVAVPGQGGEMHYSFVIPLDPDEVSRLERVELVADDGRTVERRARRSAEELAEALDRPGALEAERVDEGRARIRWDPDLLPLIMVRDPETGRIVSFARGGDVTVSTHADRLEVTVSEGVRSAVRTVPVR